MGEGAFGRPGSARYGNHWGLGVPENTNNVWSHLLKNLLQKKYSGINQEASASLARQKRSQYEARRGQCLVLYCLFSYFFFVGGTRMGREGRGVASS
jgi:hypothetical protein